MRGWWLVGALVCAGCASGPTPLPVSTFPEPPVAEEQTPQAVMPSVPIDVWPVIQVSNNPLQQIELANKASMIVPTAADFRRGTAVFPWKPGAIYAIDCAIKKATTLTFGPTEELHYWPSSGEEWTIEPMREVFPQRLIIAPQDPTLRTRLVVITSLRLITIDLRANAKTSLVEVQWELPPAPVKPVVVATRYGIGYGISEGSQSWKPSYAWDDTRHLFILFPESLLSGDAPVVAIRSGGERQLVNYRLHGRVMRIDRMLPPGDILEFQVGPDPKTRVDLQWTSGYRTLTCPGEDLCRFVQGWLMQEAAYATVHP